MIHPNKKKVIKRRFDRKCENGYDCDDDGSDDGEEDEDDSDDGEEDEDDEDDGDSRLP